MRLTKKNEELSSDTGGKAAFETGARMTNYFPENQSDNPSPSHPSFFTRLNYDGIEIEGNDVFVAESLLLSSCSRYPLRITTHSSLMKFASYGNFNEAVQMSSLGVVSSILAR